MRVDDGHSPTQAPHQSLSPMHTHTLHSLRKWLVRFSKNRGWRGRREHFEHSGGTEREGEEGSGFG